MFDFDHKFATHPRDEMTQAERLLAMSGLAGESELSPETMASAADRLSQVRIGAGTTLIETGKIPSHILTVVEGAVEVSLHNQKLVTVQAPFTLGVGYFTGGAPWTVRATSPLTAFAMEGVSATDLFADAFELWMLSLRNIARDIKFLHQQMFNAEVTLSTERAPPPPAPNYIDVKKSIDFADRLHILASQMLWASSRMDAVAELAKSVEVVRKPAGTILWEIGEVAEEFYFTISGTVVNEAPGFRQVLQPPAAVGGLDGFGQLNRTSRATVTQDIVSLRLTRAGLIDVLEDNIMLALSLLSQLWQYRTRLVEEMIDSGDTSYVPLVFGKGHRDVL